MKCLNHSLSYYTNRTRKIAKQQRNWQIEKNNIQRENDIKNEYNKIQNKNPYKITTSKLAMWFLFFVCLGIIVFTGWSTVKGFD